MTGITLPELRTPRLILRSLDPSEAEVVYASIDYSREKFTEWFTWAPYATLETVRTNLHESLLSAAAGSEWNYGMFLRGGAFCGRISLSEIDHKNRIAELGYWLDIRYHGQGLMTEAVGCMMELAAMEHRPYRIEAYTDTENFASQKVLEKNGFRCVSTIFHAVRHPIRGWRDQYQFYFIGKKNSLLKRFYLI